MKKYTFLLVILLSSTTLLAQGPGSKRFQRIKAHKTAYITDQVDLTPTEAEKFWPIYNKYEIQLHQLEVLDRKELLRGIINSAENDNLSEKEAQKIIKKIDKLKETVYQTEKEKYKQLQKFLSAKKILKLHKAEHSFRKELLNRLRGKKGKRFK